jgi:hypothetical protein
MWWSLYSCSLYTLLSGYATAVVGGGWNAVGPTPLAEEDEELSYRGMCAWVGRVRHRRFLCTEASVKYISCRDGSLRGHSREDLH